jgi:hypothetical protein
VVAFRLPSRRCNEVRWRNQDQAFVGARRIQVGEGEDAFTKSPRPPLPRMSAEIRQGTSSPSGLPVYLARLLVGSVLFGLRPCSSRTQNKSPAGIANGAFILATSYSRTACRRTTIGAAAFHFRVRNGNGWYHCATVTRAEQRERCSTLVSDSRFVTSVAWNASRSEAATVDSRFSAHDSHFQRSASSLAST